MQETTDNINLNLLWKKLIYDQNFSGLVVCRDKERFKEIRDILMSKTINTTETTGTPLELITTSDTCKVCNKVTGSIITCEISKNIERKRGYRAKIALVDDFPSCDIASLIAPRCEEIGYLDI